MVFTEKDPTRRVRKMPNKSDPDENSPENNEGKNTDPKIKELQEEFLALSEGLLGI